MLTEGINLTNFKKVYKYSKVSKILTKILKENNEIIKSLTKNYKYSFKKKDIKKFKKNLNFRIIGMGGSSLGAQAIFNFLKHKIKKKFDFVDNLTPNYIKNKNKNFTNLIISKSGNTIETIINSNLIIKKGDKNIFITEEKNNYLYLFA